MKILGRLVLIIQLLGLAACGDLPHPFQHESVGPLVSDPRMISSVKVLPVAQAPGLAEAMRAKGAERNPFAWLSRGVVGLRGATLIVNLPGSRRGAEESWLAIAALVAHGLDVARGGQTHP